MKACSFCGGGIAPTVRVDNGGNGNCVECGGRAAICLDCAETICNVLDHGDDGALLSGWVIDDPEEGEGDDD